MFSKKVNQNVAIYHSHTMLVITAKKVLICALITDIITIFVCGQAELVKAAFTAQRQFLIVASKCKPPAQQMLQTLLKQTSDQISAVQVLMTQYCRY